MPADLVQAVFEMDFRIYSMDLLNTNKESLHKTMQSSVLTKSYKSPLKDTYSMDFTVIQHWKGLNRLIDEEENNTRTWES